MMSARAGGKGAFETSDQLSVRGIQEDRLGMSADIGLFRSGVQQPVTQTAVKTERQANGDECSGYSVPIARTVWRRRVPMTKHDQG